MIVKDSRPGYRPYLASVRRVRPLSPHFVRVTFTADDFATFGTDGLDQRIKLLFPLDGIGFGDIGLEDPDAIAAGDWYARWRDLPDAERNPIRTYTVRSVRPAEREIDVDLVRHEHHDGTAGPASRWLAQASVGDTLVIVGPDARSLDSAGGIDWHPGTASVVLLAGDETAVPAICAVLESLPPQTTAHAIIEVPDAGDRLPIDAHDGCAVTWLARGDAPVGTELEPAVRAWVGANRAVYRSALTASAQALEDVDVDSGLLWDSFGAPMNGDFYAWLAGEASVIKRLRRFLVTETGIHRRSVAFMGYWRLGRAEAN